MSEPLSVCIPTYRGAARLRGLLGSIRAAEIEVEVVVCDDGSPAADLASVREVCAASGLAPRVVSLPANAGWSAAVSGAIGEASGGAVLLLDDDVLVPPGLGAALRQLLALPRVGVLSWRSCPIGERVPGCEGYLQPATELAGYCMAFRRAVWEAVGGIDRRFRVYCGDSDFALRATLAGYPSYRVWWPLVPHAEHRAFDEAPELGDRHAIAAADLAAFLVKWGATGPEMQARAFRAAEASCHGS